jgi:hypothetical protein
MFLRSAKQSERRSRNHKKYAQGDQQFDEREPTLALPARA